MNDWLTTPPPILLFTGKGGVGKTSLACASSIALSDAGKKVLLVSTDPASNLDEVLNTPLTGEPCEVRDASGLFALNIDPMEAAATYRDRMIEPLKDVLPEEALRNIEEQLSGACTVEIAAFNEFTRLIGDEKIFAEYDHVVLDTAPTGHTLRLLSLPAAWNDFIADNQTGSSCLGPLAGLKEQRKTYEEALRRLRDSDSARVIMVSRPEPGSLREAARAAKELAAEKILGLHLLVNGVFESDGGDDPLAASWAERAVNALRELPQGLKDFPMHTRPYTPGGLLGAESLRRFLKGETRLDAEAELPELPEHESLSELVDDLAAKGPGVIMTMGKGGVGKTTLAAAIARGLALKGLPVHLSTTDPAAHVADALGEGLANLSVDRIDPREVTRQHIEKVMAESGADLDAQGRALLEEELRSPCTEEVAVFQAFARTVARGGEEFVVLDTAPTGHTLLLLDASEAYHREVLRDQGELPDEVKTLLPKLRDSDFTRVLVTTLPEATPVHEAAALQEDLRRAGIEPAGWIINQSLAGAQPREARLRTQAQREAGFLREVADLSQRFALVPWQVDDPSGPDGLDQLLNSLHPQAHKSLETV